MSGKYGGNKDYII